MGSSAGAAKGGFLHGNAGHCDQQLPGASFLPLCRKSEEEICRFSGSQYPTCNTLLGLWRLLIAKKLRVREATREVTAFLRSVDLHQLLDPRMWPKLGFFALIQ